MVGISALPRGGPGGLRLAPHLAGLQDVRSKVAAGASVILCDHTNTERGYLPLLARRIAERIPSVDVTVSSRDRDPLAVV